MSRFSLAKAPRLGVAIGAALLLPALGASSASAASNTVKVVGSKLYLTSTASDNNYITIIKSTSVANTFTIYDTDAAVSLANGGGLGTLVQHNTHSWTITPTTTIKTLKVSSGNGNDYVSAYYSDLRSQLLLGGGNDEAEGSNVGNTIDGHSGNDLIWGGSDDDTLIGGSGTDTFDGGAGDDLIYANDGATADTVAGGAGDDEVSTNGGDSIAADIELIRIL